MIFTKKLKQSNRLDFLLLFFVQSEITSKF